MSNAVDTMLGGKIAEMREMRGMSVAELAAAIETSIGDVTAIESGAHVAPVKLLMISRALRVSLGAFLFDVAPHPFGGQRAPVSAAEGLSLVKAFNRIKPVQFRAILLDIADYLASDDIA